MSVTITVSAGSLARWYRRWVERITPGLLAKAGADALQRLVMRHLQQVERTRHATAQRLGATPTGFWSGAAQQCACRPTPCPPHPLHDVQGKVRGSMAASRRNQTAFHPHRSGKIRSHSASTQASSGDHSPRVPQTARRRGRSTATQTQKTIAATEK